MIIDFFIRLGTDDHWPMPRLDPGLWCKNVAIASALGELWQIGLGTKAAHRHLWGALGLSQRVGGKLGRTP